MAACNCVALTKVVVRFAPFHFTAAPDTKPVPLTASVNAAPPADAVDGASDVIVGTGFDAVIVKVSGLEVPPPGEGLNTVTCAVPVAAMSAAVMETRSCVALEKTVVRFDPFHRTVAPETKPVPFTVRLNAAVPATAVDGANEVIVGTGLDVEIVNVMAFEVPPPGAGLNTVTCALPATAMSAAVIAACNCVVPTKTVVRADPFHFTTAPETNPDPFTISENAAPPATAVDGPSEVIVGTGLDVEIVNVMAFEVPPPGAGLNTVTCGLPAAAMSAAVIAACNCVVPTKTVVRADPFHFTTAPETNPDPFTISENAALPATAVDGASEVIVGTAFGALTVNINAFDVPPPGAGLNTVTCGLPAAAISAAVIAACNWVAFTKVVIRLDPFQFTIAPETNPVPVTISVNAEPPATTVDGASEVIVGTAFGALTVNINAFEVPPPGAGLNTVTCGVPAAAISAAVIAACNCVVPTKTVVRADPFHFTTAPETNPDPFTISENAAPPATAVDGPSEVIVGTELAGLTVTDVDADVPLREAVSVGD